ncbi:uncharacterized protein CDAR_126121 [Caerostris darwini]|uniref:Uncharacterized protein n=1 Tax=Caerostris darwini TaxID=1538125 RepID=A0AAV4SES5_9ARAC|nr:uncharacterized protein CDAR_126121 [Caerostris darwini]
MIGHGTFCGQTRRFSLQGIVNTHNMVIGKSISKCNCVVWVDGIVYCNCTIVFRGGVSRYCTINGKRSLLRNQVIQTLQQHACQDRILFMQDGAPPALAKPVMQLLKEYFGSGRIISRHFPTTWLARSLDLNPSGCGVI